MKKLITILILFGLISTQANAQKFYLNMGSGYGVNIGGLPIITYSTTYNITIDTSTQYNDYYSNTTSLGKGIMPEMGVGFRLNKTIFLELNASFLYGKPITIKNTDQYNLPYGYSSAVITSRAYTGQSILLTPSVMFRTNQEKVNYYVKMGLSLGSSVIYLEGNTKIYNAFSGPGSPFTTIMQKWQYYMGLSYGLDINAGMDMPFIWDNINVFKTFINTILFCI